MSPQAAAWLCNRCRRDYITNFDIGATLPFTDDFKHFYRERDACYTRRNPTKGTPCGEAAPK